MRSLTSTIKRILLACIMIAIIMSLTHCIYMCIHVFTQCDIISVMGCMWRPTLLSTTNLQGWFNVTLHDMGHISLCNYTAVFLTHPPMCHEWKYPVILVWCHTIYRHYVHGQSQTSQNFLKCASYFTEIMVFMWQQHSMNQNLPIC